MGNVGKSSENEEKEKKYRWQEKEEIKEKGMKN